MDYLDPKIFVSHPVGIRLQVPLVECFPEHLLEKIVPHTEN